MDLSTTDRLYLRAGSTTTPLAYVAADGRIYLVAAERSGRWAAGALRQGLVDLALPDRSVRGHCRLLPSAVERARVLELFRQKYGRERIDRWFDPPGRVLAIDLGTTPNMETPSAGAYHTWLEAEFDSIAAGYDHHILDNRINRLLRDRSLELMRETFADAHRIIEIGCGSGTETLELMQDGHEIVAVDISQQMLDVVRAKARARGLTERLTTIKRRAAELGTLTAELGEHQFDGAYSTYGALNCEPDLAPVPAAIHALLRPSRALVAGVYNRLCLFEIAMYSILGRWWKAYGRLRTPVPVGVSRFCVDAYAYSVPEFIHKFEPWFQAVRLEGVPVLLPPSDLALYVEKLSRHFDVAQRIDRRVGRWPLLDGLGDHFLVVLRAEADAGRRSG